AAFGFGDLPRSGAFNQPGYADAPGGPSLYETDIILPAADQAKTLSQVRFVQTNSSRLGIFALAGVNISQPPVTYPNAINVTANSTLDVTSAAVPSVAVGALTMS